MIKIPSRNDNPPRRLPQMGMSWSADDTVEKGRKHEAFDTAFYSGDRRSLARALRFDRKR